MQPAAAVQEIDGCGPTNDKTGKEQVQKPASRQRNTALLPGTSITRAATSPSINSTYNCLLINEIEAEK
jgi:hypothetical protein